ncbi:MAG: PASTA domain-containing protein [Muribaculaceae bacterium]|nr:PASTA domain-containing protein [Muribaculaceae bacterium]
MKETNKRHILWRYSFIVTIVLLFSAAIVWNMFKTSVVYSSRWNNKADSILTQVTIIEPERGKLLADNGTVLAANLQFYIARIDWLAAGMKKDTLDKYLPALCDSLAVLEPSKTAAQWRSELTDSYQRITTDTKKRNHSYRLIRRLLTHSEWQRLKQFPFCPFALKKKVLYCERQNKRSKPYGTMASRSIGNVAQDSTSSSMHGRSGLEMALDSMLYGIPGEATRIQLTNNIVNHESKPAIPGYDITTTINVALQDIVENELYDMCHETDARWGTCVLMEVATGEIKAISNLEWNDKAGDYVEGRNNAVLGYEPGSVMKPISMMIALEEGVVGNIDAPITTGTTWIYEGRAINDPHGGAQLTPRQIIETSSNVGMSRLIVKRYGNNPGGFYDKLKSMGFFEPFHSGIGGEQAPIIHRLGNTRADKVALTRMAFGYSTLIPPLSTLAMYNAIANDGKYVRPHLVKKLSRDGEPDSIVPVTYIRQQVCSPENAQKLRIMMHDVVWGSRGTARKWVQDKRVPIAGKTGTAYTITSDGHYGTQKRLAFCGFFPYDNPKYSCVVLMLGANRGAGASSGMVLKNIALKMYARGLLGNEPNYALTVDEQGNPVKKATSQATLFASTNPKHTTNVRKGLAIDNAKVFQQPAATQSGVPNVRGLSVRDAIRRLEDAGLCVRFTGSGFVAGQSLTAGSKFVRGQVINLTLRN